jgi:hypothetical protein
MYVIIHNLLFTEEDEVDYHIYCIETLCDMMNFSAGSGGLV